MADAPDVPAPPDPPAIRKQLLEARRRARDDVQAATQLALGPARTVLASLGDRHPLWALALDCLAVAAEHAGDRLRAEALARRAVEVASRARDAERELIEARRTHTRLRAAWPTGPRERIAEPRLLDVVVEYTLMRWNPETLFHAWTGDTRAQRWAVIAPGRRADEAAAGRTGPGSWSYRLVMHRFADTAEHTASNDPDDAGYLCPVTWSVCAATSDLRGPAFAVSASGAYRELPPLELAAIIARRAGFESLLEVGR